jgi:hypothetical protein
MNTLTSWFQPRPPVYGRTIIDPAPVRQTSPVPAFQLSTPRDLAMARAAQVHAIAYVGIQAMHAIAAVTQVEVQLSDACLGAYSRLERVADATAIAIGRVVESTARSL